MKMTRKIFEDHKKVGKDKNYYKGDFTTPEDLVIDLLKLIPFKEDDFIIDAGSGKNKVWYNNFPENVHKIEIELSDGNNFYNYDYSRNAPIDWVIGNPPFTDFIKFIFKSADICKKGFAFLTNHSRINQLTPKRLTDLENKGFYLNHIHIIGCKKWFGRYYFLIWTKEKSPSITWNKRNYGGNFRPLRRDA